MKSTPPKLRVFFSRYKVQIALVAIIILAIFFRFWRLDSLPPGLHPDEAANGLDVFRIQQGDIRAIYNTNNPRESLFFFLQAIFISIFGNSILALRLAPALIGVGAVIATYLSVRSWFSERTALISAFLLASAPWAVTVTRNGFRASMLPLMIPLSVWLFTKVIQNRRWQWSVLAGISFGAGFYTYLAFRMTPLIVLAIGIFAALRYRAKFKLAFKPLLLSLAVTAVVLLPLGFHGLRYPSDLGGGRKSVSFMSPEFNHGQPLQTLGKTIVKTALMFNFKGDPNYRHNFAQNPMLDGFTGLMFVMGLLLSLRRILDIRYFSLLIIFGAMLIPEILTAEGIPHALRAIGVVPVIYIFAAIAISEFISRWQGVFPRNKAAQGTAMGILILLLGLSTFYNYQRYFVAWANDPNTFYAYREDLVAVAGFLNENPYAGKRYVVIDGYTNYTVQYLTHNKSTYSIIEADRILNLRSENTQGAQIIVLGGEQRFAKDHLAQIGARSVSDGTSKQLVNTVLYQVYELSPQ